MVTNKNLVSTEKPPVDHQWGGLTFYNRISGLRYKLPSKAYDRFSVIMNFFLLKTAITLTSEIIVQPDDPWITLLIATQYDCSKQYNLRPLF